MPAFPIRMNMLGRLRRKIETIRRYPRLAWKPADRRDLWLLGLSRTHIISPGLAACLTTRHRRCITPGLDLTRGQRVRLELGHDGQIDVFDEIFLGQIYDLRGLGFVPDLVADCGGYCGYFTAMAAGFFPQARLVCFEANPDNIPMLEAQLALLGSRVELHASAVYVHEGFISFSGTGLGGAVTRNQADSRSRTIPCEDFPRWLQACAPQRLVWKLDVEGAEAELLPATLPHLPATTTCFLETHHPDATCEALLAPYRAAGFSVDEIRRRPAAGGRFDYVEWRLQRQP